MIRSLALGFVASAAAVVTLAACSSSSSAGGGGAATGGASTATSASSAPLYNEVPAKYRKGITVAIQTNAPPLSETGTNGQPSGEDPELFAALSKELGVPITVEPTSFENELLGLSGGKYDFVGQTNVTAAREKLYDQLAQFKDGYQFAALSSSPGIGDAITNVCGKTIASQVGDQSTTYLQTVSSQCTAGGKSPITLVQLPSLPEGYVTVASGRAQATVAPLSTLSYFMSQKGQQLGKSWKLTGPDILPVYAGYSFPKGSDLITVVQKGIQALMDNGTYAQILKANGLSANITTKALINPTPLATG